MISELRSLWDFPGAAVVQNLHPLFVHFPIAFLSGAMVVYFAAWITKRESWEWAALWMLSFGVLGGVGAIVTGLRARDSVMVAQSVREHLLLPHEHLMIAGFSLALFALGWAVIARPMPRRGRLAFLILMLATTIIIAKGADYGGWLVFGYNAGGALPQPIEFSQ
ncbi:MAG TPA: DUF2231 domain-containing protein [Candidatus Binataceae bacterium]|nr:DUF2231 domain-containing protein [Candidatus Binataceae bacterium]